MKYSLEGFDSRHKQEASISEVEDRPSEAMESKKQDTKHNRMKKTSGQRLRKLWDIIKQYMHYESPRRLREKGERGKAII